jgi:hypothetical protein
MKKAFFKTMFLLPLLLFIASCSDDHNPFNEDWTKKFSLTGKGRYYSINDVKNLYDDPNLMGLIFIEYDNYNEVRKNYKTGERFDYAYVDNDAYAYFWNEGKTEGLTVGNGNIKLNGSILKEYSAAKGVYFIDYDDLDVFFGASYNKFIVDGSDIFPCIIDSVMLSAPVVITNISLKQEVSKNTPLTINWTGGSADGITKISIFVNENDNSDTLNLNSSGRMKIIDNTGTVTFEKEAMQYFVPGFLYDIEVTTVEPKFITLSNGKKIGFIGISSQVVTVKFIN